MILDKLADSAKNRVALKKAEIPAEVLRDRAEALSESGEFAFKNALKQEGMSFICEVKKASPSKGLISPDFRPLDIAREYEAAGADAISVLTEPERFLGSDEYLRDISAAVSLPTLRKDFVVDEYMIYEARLLGASAVLLICAILSANQLEKFAQTARKLGLSALVEAHTADEVKMALDAGAEIIGVNNRDLKTFEVDINTSLRLRDMVPQNVLYVSESGIRTAQDVANLRANGTDAVLIGETLMRSADKRSALDSLRGEI